VGGFLSIRSLTRFVSKFNIEAFEGWTGTPSHLHLIISSLCPTSGPKMTSHWNLALPGPLLSANVKGHRRAKKSGLHFYSKINRSSAHIQT
jgi:hypothetical protein